MERSAVAMGMILKYVGDEQGGRESKTVALVPNMRYEVAEIYEWPWHLMARPPGSQRWPTPGEPCFGRSPDEFETTDEEAPILRCGFVRVERLAGYFGVLLHDPKHMERFRALYYLRMPHERENFATWWANPFHEFAAAHAHLSTPLPDLSSNIGQAFFDWHQCETRFFDLPDSGSVEEVVAPDEPLKVPFLYVGRGCASYCCTACYEARAADLKTRLERLLGSIGINGVVPRLWNVHFWQRAEVGHPEAEEPLADDGLW